MDLRSRKAYALSGLAIIALFSLSYLFIPPPASSGITKEGTVTFHTGSGPVLLDVEIAETPQEQATGLMHRSYLGPGEGMLFIFSGDGPRTFWMKNTLIPLDMIFVNSSLSIVHIEADAQPCKTISCPTYPSERPAMYVVEANAGFAEMKGIQMDYHISLN